MKRKGNCIKSLSLTTLILSFIAVFMLVVPRPAIAQEVATHPEPVVAIHVSELTQALETMPAKPPTPPAGPDTTGYEWAYTAWHYFVAYESLKEALRSDGTPFVEISDADITSGDLLYQDGSPRYPILISLASEAISDVEIAPLRDYVNGGGFLLVGSSAFTRNPNGTMRGDFALANEMGVSVVDPSLDNWDVNMEFTKVLDHPLVSHIPSGTLNWRMPLTSEEIPLQGVDPNVVVHGNHYIWRIRTTDATVIASGSSTPLLTIKNYGKGTFIYHSVFQPLIGHGGYDSGMYAYLVYRNAIERAFLSANEPIIRLSPWRYQYDAAFVVRHDFENYSNMIRAIETSAAFEWSEGVQGDYYFCTGTLREHMADKDAVISSLRRAVSLYGATIGSHNGGLKNPVDLSLNPLDYDYWHWGPDDVLDTVPSGYTNGKVYAEASIEKSFIDIESWLDGVDNGRSGCGTAGTCPRVWVSPKFNSNREDSYDILEKLNAVTVGEQKVSPFPHWTVSTQTKGKRYEHLTLPVSDWYVGSDVSQTLDDHTSSTMHAAVDFYYNLGALINFYGHNPSDPGNLQGEYLRYSAAKPRIWATNSTGVYDWWSLRSNVNITPTYSEMGEIAIAGAIVTGATDNDTTVEIAIPGWNRDDPSGLQVFIEGSQTTSDNYRITNDGVKVKIGASVSAVEVRYPTVQAASLSITTTSLPAGTIDEAYLATMTASGGNLPYSWSISDGSLPSGLILADSGIISGTPTEEGTFNFTVQVTDSSGPVEIIVKALSITISATTAECTSNCTIWPSTAVPGLVDSGPDTPLELGVKFMSDVDGMITGIRFYKASANTGTHVANLWSSNGTRLATATFTGETASGWQQVNFATPVPISADTVYVASYHTNVGHYGFDEYYFEDAGVDNPPLHSPADGEFGGNGVYVYSSTSTFPNESWHASHAWIDVVFQENVGPPDTTPPTVTVFTIPSTSASLTVAITSFTATDNVSVTGYLVTESAAVPSPTAGGWSATAPASYTFATTGSKTLYAWAKDAAGNVSTSRSASVTITLADTTPPTVTAFTIPSTSATLTVAITSFTATDTVGVTGYLVTESAAAPSPSAGGWSATAPASYTFATTGSKTLYAWAKDAAGNVSTSRSASVTITLADTTPPTVTAFTIPSTSATLTVAITSFTATDTIGVTGYLVNESAAAPSPSSGGWSATAPASYTFATTGSKTLYAWARDAAGNVSASRSASVTITLPSAGPEPAGWYVGDMHVHRSCGGPPIDLSTMRDYMDPQNLAVISLLADMGNGEVQDPVTDLSLVDGLDDPISTPGRIVHWDAEWHWDPTYTQYPHQALGGHIVALGLTQASQIWEEYTYPILEWAHQQGGIAGFAHMQALDDGIQPPEDLNCCKPIEYPVEVALGSADFISEDYNGSDSFIEAYYRLLNTGFRPGFAAGSDFPCSAEVGPLLTYVQTDGAEMTYRNWIDGIAQGRTVISRNGHNEFLNLTVNGSATPGDEIDLTGGGSVSVTIQWTANQSLSGTIELVKNGEVVNSVSRSVSPGTPASLNATVDFTKSGWLAARRMSGGGHQVHTAAVFVTVDNAPVRASVEDAEFYVQWMDNLLEKTSPGAEWSSFFPTRLAAVRTRYQEARDVFEQIALEAGGVDTPPTVILVTPTSGATNVNTGTPVTVTFSEPMDQATIDGATFELRNSSNQLVSATVVYNGSANTATLTPAAALADSATYTARVYGGAGGVTDATGTPMSSDYTWSFTTAAAGASGSVSLWDDTALPAILADPDTDAVELGVKFRSDVDGYITALRFYKSSTNTGTHVGNLWTAGGTLLASVTFTNETASGWQEMPLPTPVAITAATTYIASYHTSVGHYGFDEYYFASAGVDNPPLHAPTDGEYGGNGVYAYSSTSTFPNQSWHASNTWVDVVFQESLVPDVTPPTVFDTTPLDDTVDVSTGIGVTVTFSEPMDVGTISTDTFELRDATSGLVPATVIYNSGINTATLDPTAPLNPDTTYTATVDGMTDLAGNPLFALYSWSFTTTATPAGCTSNCTIWPSTAVPGLVDSGPDTPIEMGVKFMADVDGTITGIRFYKASTNTGTHVANLWSNTGTRLATATFTGETASGWQQVNFATPVPISADTVYVASYHTNVGHYGFDEYYFATGGVDNPPLHAPADGEYGGNGVYAYSSTSTFPNQSWHSSHAWVDVVFNE